MEMLVNLAHAQTNFPAAPEPRMGTRQPRPQGLPRGGARAEEDPGKIR